jgi:hypothetical protein
MGFWSAIKSGASWVGDKAEDAYEGVKDAGEWVGDKAEDAYEGVKDAGEWVGDKAEDAWDWTANESKRWKDAGISFYEGVKEGGKAVFTDFGEGMAHIGNGIYRLGTGDFEGGAKELGGGLAQATVGGIFDGGAMILSGTVSGVQVIGHAEEVGRSLTGEEIEALRAIYGNAIDYSDVRIKEGSAGVLTALDRPWTSGNTIYMNKDRSDGDWMQTLVHEMGHVWQFQNGGADYQSKSVSAQYITRDAYQWESAALEEKPWQSLNPEDQAALIEAMWASGFFTSGKFEMTGPDGKPVDRTAYAEKVVDLLRRGIGAP